MNKNLYIILIAFLGLTAAAIIANTIIGFQVGPEIYRLDSFANWFLVMHITGVIGSILLLMYYYYSGFRVAFYTAIISIIANLSYAAVIYITLMFGGLRDYYMHALLFSLGGITIYALSLIFSNTRKKFWLKLAGVCLLAICLVIIPALIVHMYPKEVRINAILSKIVQWTPIAGGLINGLFIINFLDEMRAIKTVTAPAQETAQGIFGLAAIVAFLFTIVLGTQLATQSHTNLFWRDFNAAKAQQMVKSAGGAKTFVNRNGDSLHYILIKPQHYDPQKKYPLVVCLPYGGYEAGAAEILSTGVCSTTYPAFIFVPYCPDGEGWGGIPGVPSIDTLVYETIRALNDPGIDVKRRYVTGVSRGAYGTWQFICSRPDMFAAAMPVSGAGDPKLASKIVDMPIWAFHGAKDMNVPVNGSRDMIAAIKKAGGHPIYTEYPDDGHNIWDKVSDTPSLWNWLFAQKQK